MEAPGLDFGGFGQGFGKVLGGFGKLWEDLGKVLKAFSQAFLCQDPRAVSRSPAERLNSRGFRPQTRVRLTLTSGLVLLSLLEWVFVCYTGFKLLTE